MYVYRGEVIVPDEVSRCFAVRNVTPRMWVDILFGKSEIDHVDGLLLWRDTDDTVSQLDVSMQDPLVVHILQSADLYKEMRIRRRLD